MRKNVQRYWLVFASRANKELSVATKHSRFFTGLKELPEPWGLGSRAAPSVPKFDGSSLAICNLTKLLKVAKSDIMYKYRREFSDDDRSDDRLVVIFRPAKVDLQHLVYNVIPTYIEAFDAYRTECFDDALVSTPAQEVKARGNKRYTVDRLGPVSFFDELLCQRAFGLIASAVVDVFKGKIEHATEIHNGAYLVGSSRILSLEESEKLSKDMHEELITHSRR